MPGGARPPYELTVDQQAVQKVVRAIRAEEDGKALRKELAGNIREALAPGVSSVQAKLRQTHSQHPSSPALGSYLASRTRAQVRLTGRSTGAAVRIPQTPALRGFKQAARRLNRTSWRHKVFGREVWVTQNSQIPGFFDNTLQQGKSSYREAIIKALKEMAQRIATRA